MTDIISFKDGKVYTQFSRENGFTDAEYTSTSKDRMVSVVITFKGQAKAKKT